MPYVSPIFSKPLKIPVGILNISPFSRMTSPASPLIPQKNLHLPNKTKNTSAVLWLCSELLHLGGWPAAPILKP